MSLRWLTYLRCLIRMTSDHGRTLLSLALYSVCFNFSVIRIGLYGREMKFWQSMYGISFNKLTRLVVCHHFEFYFRLWVKRCVKTWQTMRWNMTRITLTLGLCSDAMRNFQIMLDCNAKVTAENITKYFCVATELYFPLSLKSFTFRLFNQFQLFTFSLSLTI